MRGFIVGEHRTWLDQAACIGAGVIRVPDVTVGRELSSGALVPTLRDWEALEAPSIYAAYHRQYRRTRLVRLFIDFLVDLFAELEHERTPKAMKSKKPQWFGRAHGRQSAYIARKR